jgi:hypothetical protein
MSHERGNRAQSCAENVAPKSLDGLHCTHSPVSDRGVTPSTPFRTEHRVDFDDLAARP